MYVVFTCWHVKNSAAQTKAPATPFASVVWRNIGSDGATCTCVGTASLDAVLEMLDAMLEAASITVLAVDVEAMLKLRDNFVPSANECNKTENAYTLKEESRYIVKITKVTKKKKKNWLKFLDDSAKQIKSTL